MKLDYIICLIGTIQFLALFLHRFFSMKNTMVNERAKALKLIDRFNPKCVESKRAFVQVEKDDFLISLREMISNPLSINQGNHPLCGIACVIKIAAELDPVGLVKMSAHLYANGVYAPSPLKSSIKVASNLKNMKPVAGLTAANFVLQTSVKSFYNPVTGYNNKPGTKFNEWQGITFPYQLRQFLTRYFKIDSVNARTYFHTIEEIQGLLAKPAMIMAWTSWNQMKNPTAKFKLLEQHYVIIKKLERKGAEVILTIDNPRKSHDRLQVMTFANEKLFYKAIIGIYAFRGK
jgi:hypothetical protein